MAENEMPETPDNADAPESPSIEEVTEVVAHAVKKILEQQGTSGVAAPGEGGGNCISVLSVVEN
ncbi:hypothetical protein [Streptomyces aidingensis]|uniref:Uncharacterized protein n=1 Tax=Streptomyces aidingensis TaxID=910347 RepID=A0A1I1GZ37_9ACTN|nr:hypothetical protein [Streptomyces aidingensis]SFC17067.1 hypothetical protein SAMN05421773_102191 [Streptomyces aidingensis]